MTPHNEHVGGQPEPCADDRPGPICLLTRDGRLFGPFESRHACLYWCAAMELEGFSTYELILPQQGP